jgi:hypothetical protein
MTEGSTSAPANVTEFNANVGHVFAQLYEHFPVSIERLNRETIASAMGVPSSGESTYVLPSGRSFSQVFAHSLTWLSDEGYIRARGHRLPNT